LHLLDDAVTQVLHQIFDRISAVPDNMIVGNVQDRHVAERISGRNKKGES